MVKFINKSLFFLSLLCVVQSAFAEQVEKRDNYKIHYSAFGSTVLKPEIASHYQLVRSRYQGVINIAVTQAKGTIHKPTTAIVTGRTRNLLGQTQKVVFKEIREGEAIYYLGSFRFNNEEHLSFDISVKPDANEPPYSVSFKKKFFVD